MVNVSFTMYPNQNQDPNRPQVFSPTNPPQGGFGYNDVSPQNGQAPQQYQPGGWGTPQTPGAYPPPQEQPYGPMPPQPPQTPAPLSPSDPNYYGPSDDGPRFSPVRLIMLILIILVVVAGLGVGGYFAYKHFTKKPPVVVQKTVPKALPAKHLCSQSGTAIICQDLDTGTTLKYNTPHTIGAAYAILPSPDDSKVFIDTPANTVKNPTVSDNFYVFDKQLKVVKQLPDEKSTEDYLGFDWTADSKSLIYAKRDMNDQGQFGKASLYTYNLDTGVTTKLAGDDKYDLSVPQVGRSGETVYVENNAGIANGTLSLASVNLSNGQVQTIASGSVMQSMQTFTTYSYSRIHNLFYVSGTSAATGEPVFIIAKLVSSGGGLQLQTVKILDDGYTYTPLTSTAAGMIVSRAQNDTTTFGLIKSDGVFSSMEVSPSARAPFGLAAAFDVKAAPVSTPEVTDFLFEDVQGTPPAKLQAFLKKLVTDKCKAGTFNTVSLLGQDNGDQAAVHFTPCDSDNDRTQYYVTQNGTYKNVLETQATTIPCTDMAKYHLSKVIVPSCSKP